MGYKVKVVSPAEREAKIRSSVLASREDRDFYEFRGRVTKLKVIRIPNELMIYRMENLRTYIEQNSYLSRENKSADFFISGQENASVQQLQHDILAKLANTGIADSVVPIISVLKTEKQREPILITHRGIVVNGNRRLAAMRELLAEDGVTNSEFTNIDCLVLPEDVTPDEIVEIEAELQAKPETKLDYNWISDCMLIQKLTKMKPSPQAVAERLRRKPKEITNSLAAFQEANLYLSDWLHTPGQYSAVLDAEQFFKDLPEQLKNKDASLMEATRVIAWNLLENKSQLNERLYAFNPALKQSDEVLDSLASELGIALSGEDETDDSDDDDGFEVDVIGGEGAISYEPVIELFKDNDRKQEAVDLLIDISRRVIERNRDKKSGNAALKAVSGANAKLMEIDISRADAETLPSIDRQLDQVIKRANELKAIVAKRVAAGQ